MFRHFLPGLTERVDHLFILRFRRQSRQLKFQEDQAESIFQHPHFWICREIFLQVKFLHPLDGGFVIAYLPKNLAGFLGVEFLQVGPPFEIAGAVHGVIFPGTFPAADMLATGRQPERFGGLGSQLEHPVGEAFGIDEFPRAPRFLIRVSGIGGIKAVQGSLKFLVHSRSVPQTAPGENLEINCATIGKRVAVLYLLGVNFRCLLLLTALVLARSVGRAADTNDPGTVTIDVDAVMDAANDFARQNLDDDVLQALQNVDRDQVKDFLRHYQDYLRGRRVVDLAQLRDSATTILPLLEAHEETQPLAAWLRPRVEYLDTAAQFAATAPPVTNAVAPPNPTFKQEQEIWIKKEAPKPWPKAATEWVPKLKPIFTAERIPGELVWLAEVESGFDTRAESPAGALGLFQLMPATAKQYGLSLWPWDERKQPEPAAKAAAKLLFQNYRHYGDWRLAVAAYNCGMGTVDKAIGGRKGMTFAKISAKLPAETQMYVPKVEAVIQAREGAELEKLKLLPAQ